MMQRPMITVMPAARALGRLFVLRALLHPDVLDAQAQALIHDFGDVFARAEHIDEVDRLGYRDEVGVGLLAQAFADTGPHRDDAKAEPLHLAGDIVARAPGLGREADHRDGLYTLQQRFDLFGSGLVKGMNEF